jgi:NitT/TauT family transport system substrate-binding protein
MIGLSSPISDRGASWIAASSRSRASKKPQRRADVATDDRLKGLRPSAHMVAPPVRGQPPREETTMMRAKFVAALAMFAVTAVTASVAWSQETLKVAIPQRGAWDAGVAELGQRGGIFKKHGLNLEILYVQAGPESIQAVIGGSMDIATAAGVSAAVGTFAKGAPIRLIGSEMIGAPDLYWYVPTNSPIQKVEDFNGKTVAFSLTGSSSHAGLLALIAQHKLTAKPTSTGNIAATITSTMTGQVDVGFGAAPFGLDLLEDGKIRIIATGNDVASLRTRTVRVNLTNVNTLQNRRDAIVRFNRAYQETVDWMYSDPAALKHYGEYSNLPEKIVLRVRSLIPKESLTTDRIEGIDQIMADAVAAKFISAPLTAEQVKELVQIPK